MFKRTLAAMTFAFAMVALNGSMPTSALSAQEEIEQPSDEFAGGQCLIWCVSHQTHHRIAC